MRYLVTPAFSEKVTSAGPDVLQAASAVMGLIEQQSKEQLQATATILMDGEPSIYSLKLKNSRIFLSFGKDNAGEYALILDITFHSENNNFRPLSADDPKKNMMVDPFRNMMINPLRNMMIDPKRNMMIDPFRNMMIDPMRNMMIDPKRNMMLDLQRNMMIDPARNFSLDPKRNWAINPSQNSAWGGPLVYDLNKKITGFIVRANEQVSLLFNTDGTLNGSLIQAGEKNVNVFNRERKWVGFLVHNGAEGFNQFDLTKSWIGFVVGEIQPVMA